MSGSQTLESLLEEATRDGRICPQPQKWSELWELLPDRRRVGEGWEPPLPLILAAWCASDEDKRERFLLHVRWAHEHGSAELIYRFTREMNPENWYRG